MKACGFGFLNSTVSYYVEELYFGFHVHNGMVSFAKLFL